MDQVYVAFEGGSLPERTILVLASLLLAAGFLSGLLATLQYGLEGYLSLRVMYVLRNRFYHYVQNLSFDSLVKTRFEEVPAI